MSRHKKAEAKKDQSKKGRGTKSRDTKKVIKAEAQKKVVILSEAKNPCI